MLSARIRSKNMQRESRLIVLIKKIKHTSKQFAKFAVIGCINTVISYGTYYMLLHFGIHYMPAVITSFCAAVFVGYYLNKFWTFRSNRNIKSELPKYMAVYVSSLMINLMLLPVFVEIFHIDPKIAQLFFLFFMPIYTFTGLKYWSFK
jgi:putative flippase GtrA